MTQASITADIHQTLDVHLNPLAQVAFNFALRFQYGADPAQLVFTQIANTRVEVHSGFLQNRTPTRTANSIDIGKTNLSSLIGWKIYACYTCHLISRLSLSLLVFGIHANHPNHALAMDDLALVAHLFY